MSLLRSALSVPAVSLAIGVAALAAPATAATLFMGSYPDRILAFDEDTAAITDSLRLETGLPVSMQASPDGRLIYVTTITTSGIEVIDTATRRVINRFSLNDEATKYRFWGGAPDSTGNFFYTIVTRIDKGADKFTVGKPQYAKIDLRQKKIVLTADVEEADERAGGGRAAFKVSPDGRFLYIFGKKVIVVDTADLKAVERIDLAKPDRTGMENVGFGRPLDAITVNGQFVSLFNAADPFVHNKVFGVGRFDLNTRHFDFAPIGPAPEAMAGLQVAPDGKEAYTVATTGKYGNKRCEFWRFDLAESRLLDKAEFPCRSRFTFGLSGDGAKLYIYGASYDIEVYDAKTLKHETTWDLGHDTTGAGMVVVK